MSPGLFDVLVAVGTIIGATLGSFTAQRSVTEDKLRKVVKEEIGGLVARVTELESLVSSRVSELRSQIAILEDGFSLIRNMLGVGWPNRPIIPSRKEPPAPTESGPRDGL